jgi:uncharacterized protein
MVDTTPDDLVVVNNRAASRFEIRTGGDVAFLTYQLRGSTIAYTHTEVPKPLEGRGIASRLATYALDYARANGLDVVPLCPYVSEYIRRHPDYQDLVAPRARWREFMQA